MRAYCHDIIEVIPHLDVQKVNSMHAAHMLLHWHIDVLVDIQLLHASKVGVFNVFISQHLHSNIFYLVATYSIGSISLQLGIVCLPFLRMATFFSSISHWFSLAYRHPRPQTLLECWHGQHAFEDASVEHITNDMNIEG
jgi:hypothetical protein